MRITSSVTSVSWIPSEAISGLLAMPFNQGLAHWDEPLPDRLDDLEALRRADRFRFANELRAYADVEDGRIVDAGYLGGGRIGVTTLRLGRRSMTFAAVPFPDLQADPVITPEAVTFVQTAGGRTGAPMPRKVNRPPFIQIVAPTAWTTLSLTIRADGSSSFEVLGASPFPRHWVYDRDGELTQKSGFIDFESWAGDNYGDRTPWGDHHEPAIVTAVESALERELSLTLMRADAAPRITKLKAGDLLTEQGAEGHELFLLLDGMLSAEVDGEVVAEIGPGAVLGERALLEGGLRTSTLRARTACRVAVADEVDIDLASLRQLSLGHRREEKSDLQLIGHEAQPSL